MDHRLNALLNGPSTHFYNVEMDSSSDEEAKSSDDDIDNFDEDREENDSDSFEREMEMELNKEFLKHKEFHCHTKSQSSEQENSKASTQEKEENKKYDDEYFSSGSDEDQDNVGGVSSKSKERRAKLTDDELLYDPNMDEENENWVQKQREGHQSQENDNTADEMSGDVKTKSNKSSQKPRCIKSANSDAILSCPACLATLCIDCQRHDTYKTQFRAMFVMNCNIKTDESLRYETKNDKKKLGKKKHKEEQVASASVEVPKNELFHPVQCGLCNTEVAVYDKDEIYHFFNVVESLS